MDHVDLVGLLVSRDRQQELGQARELVRAWRRSMPQETDDDIAHFTLVWTGWDVYAVFADPGDDHVELEHHGRIMCAIAMLATYYHNHVGSGKAVLAKCLRTWEDFEAFRLLWLQHQDPPLARPREFEELARSMGLVGPVSPLRRDDLRGRAFELASHLHPILGENVAGTFEHLVQSGGPLALPSYLV